MFLFQKKKVEMVAFEDALPGRATPIPTAATHFVSGLPITLEAPRGHEVAMFGMGCFWGVERMFWQCDGVHLTMAGYAGGYTSNPTYEEVCSGLTGHNEVVRIVFDPMAISFDEVLRVFWEGHDPTQGMRQGNDIGTQYRSGVYTFSDAQNAAAAASKADFQNRLSSAGYGKITTEIIDASTFYFAEDYHQQYLAKNPGGYCGLGGTGVRCSTGISV